MLFINSKNAEIINSKEIYLHDSYLSKIEYDWAERRIVFAIDPDLDFGIITKMTFNNVVGTKTIHFDTFGKSEGRILDFRFPEKKGQKLFNELQKDSLNIKSVMVHYNSDGSINKDITTPSNIDNEEALIEVVFIFDSADEMRIVCESIEIETE